MSDLIKFVAEFIGTFVFLGVILSTGDPISIGLALAVVIFLNGKVSGGHFNPAVSAMMYAKGDINMTKFSLYVVAQILGAMCALLWFKQTKLL